MRVKIHPIRVGFVMHRMQVAGAEVLVERIIEQLGAEIEPTIICLDALGNIGERLRQSGSVVEVLGRQPGIDWRISNQIAKIVSQRKIEVLHAHQYTPFFYSALSRIRNGVRAKVIFTEHGRPYPDVISWKRRFANRMYLQRFAEITTACCDFSTESLKTVEGFRNAETLRNGVDVESFLPRGSKSDLQALRKRIGLEIGTPYAACIARFHPIKDHQTLIRGWQLVNRKMPNARLLLVGDGTERERIEKQVQENGLADSVVLLGIRQDVNEILRSVDVFSLTSVSEAASLTLLEAMSSECPSVVTDVGGNSEHLRDGLDGYLVERGDHVALAQRLIELFSNESLRRRFGKSSRDNVKQNFSLSSAVASYAEHYRTLANRKKKATRIAFMNSSVLTGPPTHNDTLIS